MLDSVTDPVDEGEQAEQMDPAEQLDPADQHPETGPLLQRKTKRCVACSFQAPSRKAVHNLKKV